MRHTKKVPILIAIKLTLYNYFVNDPSFCLYPLRIHLKLKKQNLKNILYISVVNFQMGERSPGQYSNQGVLAESDNPLSTELSRMNREN